MKTGDATDTRRFLFVLWDGGGNVPPQLAIARHLVGRGHTVRVLAPNALAARVAAAGCAFVPYAEAPEHDSSLPEHDLMQDWAARTPLSAAAAVRDRLMASPALAFARDVIAASAAQPTDIIVSDYLLLGAYLGAERAGLPFVALVHSIYPFPAVGLPPYGLGLPPARGPLGRLRDTALRGVFKRFYEGALPQINVARRALGLTPLASIFELFALPDRALILTSPSFDLHTDDLPANVAYVGPQLDTATPSEPWVGPWATDDRRPLVVASLSTTYQRQEQVIGRVVEALGGLPVRALVTTGPAIDAEKLSAAPNVMLRPYLPHDQVFPQADLVITHGGHGTTIAALAYGVPVLCLPMGRDQGDIAARVVWREAGLRRSSKASPATLRRAVQLLLDEPRFRRGARRIADAMAQEDDTWAAARELETLPLNQHQAAVLAQAV